jgi:endonuclease/exonuclease/phosphatase (EEP) superfamily protein YafD
VAISKRKFIIHMLWATALAFLVCVGLNSPASADSDKFIVKVMTRNMDAGTDLNLVTVATTPEEFATGVIQTVNEVVASRIPARALRLAGEIADEKPDLVALQEVTTWQITEGQTSFEYDQLALLQAALRARGQRYRVAAVQNLSYIPVDLTPYNVPLAVTFLDQNAILIRTDVPPGHLDLLGTEAHVYENRIDFVLPEPPGGTIPVLEGWMAADVKVRGVRFKFFNTHLLSPIPGPNFVYSAGVQAAQAGELISAMDSSSMPVILAGDFNSDATIPQHGPDKTPAEADIVSAGYLDAWKFLRPFQKGYTWPLFGEDQLAGSDPSPYFERIDLLFSRGPKPLWIERTGLLPNLLGVYASDHAGVVAIFDLDRHGE